jgi:hypothetical protein
LLFEGHIPPLPIPDIDVRIAVLSAAEIAAVTASDEWMIERTFALLFLNTYIDT